MCKPVNGTLIIGFLTEILKLRGLDQRRYLSRYSDYATGWTVWGSNPGRLKIFLSSPKESGLSLEPRQPPI